LRIAVRQTRRLTTSKTSAPPIVASALMARAAGEYEVQGVVGTAIDAAD